MSRILKLDPSGQPREWISYQDAICYHAKNMVVWQVGEGEADVTFRGGQNRITGRVSSLTTAPIIAVKGDIPSKGRRDERTPPLTNPELFRRDRHICAYCGFKFRDDRLSRDHIIPTSKGGANKWTNVVTACLDCNHMKDDQTLEQCGMKLLYVPYAPNWAEKLILENRNVLACQMDYLSSYLPEQSRIWEDLKAQAH